jgi:Rieske Fe-S protein
MKTNRRKFLNFLIGGGLLGWLASVFYPIIAYLVPPKIPEASVNSVSAGPVGDFPTNSGKIIQFGRKPVLVIKDENDDFHAFDGTCTHLDCIVQYREDSKQIWCACHNGFYDLSGRTISGPPPRPLEEYPVNIVNDEIIIINPTS